MLVVHMDTYIEVHIFVTVMWVSTYYKRPFSNTNTVHSEQHCSNKAAMVLASFCYNTYTYTRIISRKCSQFHAHIQSTCSSNAWIIFFLQHIVFFLKI